MPYVSPLSLLEDRRPPPPARGARWDLAAGLPARGTVDQEPEPKEAPR